MRRVLYALLLAMVACDEGEGGPGEGCTAIGCGMAFEVAFSRASAWSSGTYKVDVVADGRAGSCEIDFPLSCNTRPRCTGDTSWGVLQSGCALPSSQHALSGVTFAQATPATVEVSVFFGTRRLGMGRYAPTYATSQPNGPMCGPICTQAPGAALALD